MTNLPPPTADGAPTPPPPPPPSAWPAADPTAPPAPTSAPPPPPSVGAPAVANGVLTSPVGILAFVALAVAVVGSFLPWITAETVGVSLTENGLDKDGVITLALALVSAGLLFGHGKTNNRGMAIGSTVCSAICAAVYIIDLADVNGEASSELVRIEAGIGLVIGTIGAIAATLLLLVVLVKRKA